jgi:hypothetical protein
MLQKSMHELVISHNVFFQLNIQALLIITMTTEIIVVLIRNDSHVRVTRAARPLFLLDTYYFGGVRRYEYIAMSLWP